MAGGIKNALERGENLDQAKQSFLSAGYTPEEVEEAALMLSRTRKTTSQTSPLPQGTPAQKTPQQTTPTQTTAPTQKEDGKISKTMITILVAVGAVILISALLLGLFWNKLF